jgi:hypothetical protein
MNWYEFYLLIEEFIFLMKMPGSIEDYDDFNQD